MLLSDGMKDKWFETPLHLYEGWGCRGEGVRVRVTLHDLDTI
jgi:hypothetical protein